MPWRLYRHRMKCLWDRPLSIAQLRIWNLTRLPHSISTLKDRIKHPLTTPGLSMTGVRLLSSPLMNNSVIPHRLQFSRRPSHPPPKNSLVLLHNSSNAESKMQEHKILFLDLYYIMWHRHIESCMALVWEVVKNHQEL